MGAASPTGTNGAGFTYILTVCCVRWALDQVRRTDASTPCPFADPRLGVHGFRPPPAVIVLSVRWYLRYALSYRDVEELLAERGLVVDHVTVYRWIQRFTPLLIDTARIGQRSRNAGEDVKARRSRATTRLFLAGELFSWRTGVFTAHAPAAGVSAAAGCDAAGQGRRPRPPARARPHRTPSRRRRRWASAPRGRPATPRPRS